MKHKRTTETADDERETLYSTPDSIPCAGLIAFERLCLNPLLVGKENVIPVYSGSKRKTRSLRE